MGDGDGDEAKAMEDLTGAEHGSPREGGRGAAASSGRGWASRLRDGGGSRGDEATLTTIRGINLRQDHFDRIVDSDGWLTSQVIFVVVLFVMGPVGEDCGRPRGCVRPCKKKTFFRFFF